MEGEWYCVVIRYVTFMTYQSSINSLVTTHAYGEYDWPHHPSPHLPCFWPTSLPSTPLFISPRKCVVGHRQHCMNGSTFGPPIYFILEHLSQMMVFSLNEVLRSRSMCVERRQQETFARRAHLQCLRWVSPLTDHSNYHLPWTITPTFSGRDMSKGHSSSFPV